MLFKELLLITVICLATITILKYISILFTKIELNILLKSIKNKQRQTGEKQIVRITFWKFFIYGVITNLLIKAFFFLK